MASCSLIKDFAGLRRGSMVEYHTIPKKEKERRIQFINTSGQGLVGFFIPSPLLRRFHVVNCQEQWKQAKLGLFCDFSPNDLVAEGMHTTQGTPYKQNILTSLPVKNFCLMIFKNFWKSSGSIRHRSNDRLLHWELTNLPGNMLLFRRVLHVKGRCKIKKNKKVKHVSVRADPPPTPP